MWSVGSGMSLLLTLLPIAVILCMLIFWKKPADISGVVGWLTVAVLAFFFFKTSIEVIFRSTAAGLIKSFPGSLCSDFSIANGIYGENRRT